MHSMNIKGLDITMPFPPYEAQIQSIEAILSCLQNKESGMIESPTGTGKTLSILCTAIAWIHQRRKEGKHAKVIICSRTHKQINQLINQYKQLSNPPQMTLLAARKNVCLNPAVRKEPDIDAACKRTSKSDSGGGDKCKYLKIGDKLDNNIPRVFNIEDLRSCGSQNSICPYFMSRKAVSWAKIIFAPYNYVMHPGIRKAMNINLDDTAIIIDEGHNIEDVCRSSGSIEIDLQFCESMKASLNVHREVSANLKALDDREKMINNSYIYIQNILSKIIAYIKNNTEEKIKIKMFSSKNTQDTESVVPNREILKELDKMGFTQLTKDHFIEAVSMVIEQDELSTVHVQFLEQFSRVVHNLFSSDSSRYKYGMTIDANKAKFYCLHAELVFESIVNKARCIVLLSGTLAPFTDAKKELFSKKDIFKHVVEAPHVIDQKQVMTVCVPAYNNNPIEGVYAETQKDSYIHTIATLVGDITRTLNGIGGVLCFVSNYTLLERLAKKIPPTIRVFKEDTNQMKFDKALAGYKENSQKGNALFLCVFRGKASEGIDFRDHESRAVIIVGVPFPNLKDKGICLKREYNDKHMNRTGALWYEWQAYKPVNQALGRCIRHIKDWGSIFLVDKRYLQQRNLNKLSKWSTRNLFVCTKSSFISTQYKTFITEHFSKTAKTYATAANSVKTPQILAIENAIPKYNIYSSNYSATTPSNSSTTDHNPEYNPEHLTGCPKNNPFKRYKP
ncbi:hypothetical protein NEOKW01_1948 [Nematocida sp. AWRm80]|nr:hypothetical protein NEOKW01_1948 [Nematocida sp. AWRm80]